ncbi:MAG: gliding motility-associated C-terminal domain-containing protein [Cytophagaceae bacterium]|nr:gliding motility-associated C-terminal domain-containing protein [Cytophagaceae bacterium]
MRRLTFLLCLLFPLCLLAAEPGVRFVRNEGQWEPAVRFRADIPGGFLLLKEHGLQYIFYDAETLAARHDGKQVSGPLRAHGVEVVLEGASPNVRLEGVQPDEVGRSYFLGDRQASGVQAFGEIWYRNIYPGVDLRLYTYQNTTLKYEFVVAPGANPNAIRMRYDGADQLTITENNLVVKTSLGSFKELKPYSYQETANRRTVEVESGFRLEGNLVRFALAESYDARLPLVIDPVLIFSTYSGSVADNWGHTATYDAEGNLYSGGTSMGTSGFPVTNGAFQLTNNGEWDVAILKFSPDGTKLLHATYLGGNQTEVPHSLIVNSKGELVIFGTTSSENFPTTATAYDRIYNGGTRLAGASAPISSMNYVNGSDLFVAKLSADGKQLLAATYLGGSGNDGLNLTQSLAIQNYGDPYRGEVMTDATDRVFIASVTSSGNFPLVKASQSQRRGDYDAVVLRLSADLSALEWSTLLGGRGFDAAYGLRVATSGNVYVCGTTTSDDLGATSSGANQGVLKPSLSGTSDGFVARFSATPSLSALSYLGTNDADVAQLLDLDKDENVYVLGLSAAGRYPVSAGVYQNAGSSQFIQALNKDLTKSIFSTVVGSGRGTPDIIPTAFLVSECGNLYLSGWGGKINENVGSTLSASSSTRGLPVTPDAHRTSTDGNNFYLMMLEAGAKSLLYATFFGSTNTEAGDHVDGGTCRFDKRGFIYHAACACNRPGSPSNFSTTPGVWSQTNPSPNCNNAAFKFDIDRLKVSFDVYQGTRKDTITGCLPVALRFVNTSEGGRTYQWNFVGPNGNTAQYTGAGEIRYTFANAGKYTITLKGTNLLSCQREATVTRVFDVKGDNFSISPDVSVCSGTAVQLKAEGGVTYRWSPAESLTSSTIANPIATPKVSTAYKVQITDATGCQGERTVNVKIDDGFKPDFSLEKSQECNQPVSLTLRLNNPTAERYIWIMGNGDTLRTNQPEPYRYNRPGSYTVTLQTTSGACQLTTVKPIEIEPPLTPPNVVTPNGDGRNDVFALGQRGLKVEIYNRWGKLLLKSDDYADTWGGGVSSGTYYYLITAPSGAKCKGWVEVLQ